MCLATTIVIPTQRSEEKALDDGPASFEILWETNSPLASSGVSEVLYRLTSGGASNIAGIESLPLMAYRSGASVSAQRTDESR